MTIPFKKIALYSATSLTVLTLSLKTIPHASAWCWPSLYTCYCTYVFPCPIADPQKFIQQKAEDAGWAGKLDASTKIYSTGMEIYNIYKTIHNGFSNISIVSIASQDALTLLDQYNQPVTTMPQTAQDITTLQNDVNNHIQATLNGGAGDTPAISSQRQHARNALLRQNALSAYTRSIQYKNMIARYQQKIHDMQNAVQVAQTEDMDWQANAAIKRANHEIEQDIREAIILKTQLRAAEAIQRGSGNSYDTSTGIITPGTAAPIPGSSSISLSPSQQSAPYEATIQNNAHRYGVPAGLIRWQINQDTHFNNTNNTDFTAGQPGYGIPGIGPVDLYQRINYTAQYDAILYQRSQDWDYVAQNYNK